MRHPAQQCGVGRPIRRRAKHRSWEQDTREDREDRDAGQQDDTTHATTSALASPGVDGDPARASVAGPHEAASFGVYPRPLWTARKSTGSLYGAAWQRVVWASMSAKHG